MRILAIDFGKARLGLALSDPTQTLATALPFLPAAQSIDATIQSLLAFIKEKGPIVKMIVGLPLHLSGHESPMSALTRTFADKLEEAAQIPVILWDERLSTAQAEKSLKSMGKSRKKRAALKDSESAAILLQSYLDANIS